MEQGEDRVFGILCICQPYLLVCAVLQDCSQFVFSLTCLYFSTGLGRPAGFPSSRPLMPRGTSSQTQKHAAQQGNHTTFVPHFPTRLELLQKMLKNKDKVIKSLAAWCTHKREWLYIVLFLLKYKCVSLPSIFFQANAVYQIVIDYVALHSLTQGQ